MTALARHALVAAALVAADIVLIALGLALQSTPCLWAALGVTATATAVWSAP